MNANRICLGSNMETQLAHSSLTDFDTLLTARSSSAFSIILWTLIFAIVVIFDLEPLGQAQTTVGIQPLGSYAVNFDQINLADLSVHIDIPLFKHKARGTNAGVEVHLTYDSPDIVSGLGGWSLSGGTARYGSINANLLSSIPCPPPYDNETAQQYTFIFTDITGYSHLFNGISTESDCPAAIPPVSINNSPTVDGSGYLLSVPGSRVNAVVTDPSGTTYDWWGSIIESNGNTGSQTSSYSPPPGIGRVTTFTDSSNISATITYGYNPSNPNGPQLAHTPSIIQYTDTAGKTQQITILYSIGIASGSGLVRDQVDSVTLPDGSAYHFTYQSSPYTPGIIASVTLPTSGTITYQNPVQSGCSTRLIRTTSDGSTTYDRVVNSYDSNPCLATTSTTTISKPDGGSETIHFVDNLYPALYGNVVNLETAHAWFNASGTLMKSTMKCYNGASGDCTTTAVTLPATQISTKTTLDSGQSSQVVQFLNGNALPTEIDEYDFGASKPTRKTITSYASLGNNISDRPSSLTIFDGSGNQISQTTYGYDEYNLSGLSLLPTSGLPSHNAVTGARGNLTTKHVWLNTSGGTLTSYERYDDAGQVVATEDPRLNWTQYGYDSATDSCVISITPPVPSSGVSQTTSATCDANTGLVASVTDSNNVTTTYSYDSMLRLTGASTTTQTGVLAASMSRSYSESSLPEVITTTVTATPSPNRISTTTLDGYGRAAAVVDASGATVATTYDNMGRVYSISNPYFSTPYGVTSYAYDALGRTTLQTQPDGKTESWSYSGNTVTFADENSNQRQNTMDALGRLTQVLEPNGSSQTPSLETDYKYDALNNLTSVTQWGGVSGSSSARTRSFSYDSLSRLIQSSNPETGVVCYGTLSSGTVPNGSNCTEGYDGNGNLLYKNDARGVTTNYSYDGLNRLISKTYTNAPAGTLSSCYQFDTATKGIGRLSAEWTQAGSCSSTPPANYQSLRTYGAYDAMGRPLAELQCAAGYCTSASMPSSPSANCVTLSGASGLQYCYDLAGNLLAFSNGVTTQTAGSYPQQALLLSQTFDSAGHLATVGSSWSDSTHPASLFSNPSYAPNNALSSWLLGSNLWTARQYDNRLRLCNQQSAQQQITAPQCAQ